MHELSLSSAILETTLRHAEGRKVNSVQMRIGAMRQVVSDSLEFYFEIVSRGTLVAGAELETEFVAVLLHCEDCATEWSPEIPAFRCPGCGGAAVEIRAGNEFEIDSIIVDEEEAACIAPR